MRLFVLDFSFHRTTGKEKKLVFTPWREEHGGGERIESKETGGRDNML